MMIEMSRCRPQSIRCAQNIALFSRRLVKDIDMVAYGKPQIVRFGSGDKAGYTLVQLIETSNIAAHFCEESNDAYVDVFSCKAFDPKVVRCVARAHFSPESFRYRLVKRDAAFLR
jgi:S-adenosylmethionine/arginine decarboxylase-like enzyme